MDKRVIVMYVVVGDIVVRYQGDRMSFEKIAQNVDQPNFFLKINAYPLKWKKLTKNRIYFGNFHKTA
jgi:hypothetical protein